MKEAIFLYIQVEKDNETESPPRSPQQNAHLPPKQDKESYCASAVKVSHFESTEDFRLLVKYL